MRHTLYDTHFNSIRHIDKKWRNSLIESDHAAMKRTLGYRQSFRSLRSAKATLSADRTVWSVFVIVSTPILLLFAASARLLN